MKSIKNYILLVDYYRRPSRRRNTRGRYRVGAKTEKEAVNILRRAIKFGSIQVYYDATDSTLPEDMIGYKKIQRECTTLPVRSAIAPQK